LKEKGFRVNSEAPFFALNVIPHTIPHGIAPVTSTDFRQRRFSKRGDPSDS